ncbi:MAG: tatC [Sporomusa sp.]|jgi:sec-independent protein translocase protein TatC|nr:tatC [Sporomusa sp.]
MERLEFERSKGEMTLVGHLEELRTRLIKVLAALGATSVTCYYYVDSIISWMILPAGKLYYMNPAEAFFTYCKVALVGGFFISIPVILYQFWAFVIPALTEKELSIGFWLVPGSVALFYSGVVFSHYFVVPAAVKFFMGFSTEFLQPMFSLGQYVSLVISLLFPFGMIFELPLFIVVMAYFGIVSSRNLIHYRKYAIVIAFVLGGVISPTPDMFGQAMLAIPIILLYELSIVISKYCLAK